MIGLGWVLHCSECPDSTVIGTVCAIIFIVIIIHRVSSLSKAFIIVNGAIVCSGVLIGPRHVLTVATCSHGPGDVYRVYLGHSAVESEDISSGTVRILYFILFSSYKLTSDKSKQTVMLPVSRKPS